MRWMLVVGTVTIAAGTAAWAEDVSVLVLSERSVCWERPARLDAELKADLAEAGLAVHEANAYYHDVTPELLAQHSLVIMLYPPVSAGSTEAEGYITKGRLVLDYAQSGGGLLVLGDNNYDSLKPLNAFLQQIDATVLPEGVVDEETEFRQARFFREYFLTTQNLTDHPLTAGVDTLCFPSAWHRWKAGATNAVTVGADWEVIVRGNESARSMGWRADVDGQTTYDSAPPIVAARALGDGRVALCPMRSVTTIQSGHHFVFESTCYERGDLTRFVANALRWLSEPARGGGQPGGYVEPEAIVEAPGPSAEELAVLDPYTRLAAMGFREPISQVEHEYMPRRDFVGIIGIYSDFSRRVSEPIIAGGLGTVAEYCARARELGYSFLAFTERFEVMDEAKWDQLVAQCGENSDESFIAIPGIEIQDVNGDRYACIDLPGWVQDEWLDPSGRYMLDHPGFYFGLTHSLTTFLGKYLLSPRQSFVQPWFQKFYAGMEVFGYRRGDQPAGEAEDWYQTCQSNDYNLIPIATHGISSPNDLANVAGYRTHVLADAVEQVPAAFRYGWYSPRDVYVSSGPRLAEWAIENGRGGLREEPWKLFVRLESDALLREVTIWDRGQVFRRYYSGEREIALEIAGHHDKQRHFVLTAEDEAGERLVSSALYTSDVRHSTYMCTDLQNTINSMVDASRAGKQSYIRVQGLYVTGWDSLDVPALVTEKDVLPESGIEYGLAPMAGAAGPVIHAAGKTEHSVAQRLMALGCGDVNVLDNRYAWTLLPGSYMAPTELADSRVRLISFTPRAYGPNIMLVEHTVTLRKDVTLADRPGPEIALLQIETGASQAEARGMLTAASEGFPEMRVAGANGVTRDWSDRSEPIELTLEAGGYAAFYPNFWGSLAVFPLSDGLVMRTGHYTEVGIDSPGAELAAGTELTARCLVVRGAFGEATAEEFDRLRDVFGVDGALVCEPKIERGELVDSRYVLRVRADDGAARLSLKQVALPNPQPIVAEGLRENRDIVALVDDEFRRVAAFEGAGWLTVDPTDRPLTVVVGNAADCSSEALTVSLLRDEDRWAVEVHNPTNATVEASIAVPEWLAATVGTLAANVTLGPGETSLLSPKEPRYK